ncbi:hypothetical protein LF41_3136 [Lysobacter dokdonensis DS-58]|uniref:DUF4350 domain-containing protein n=1 Tax=Lysobacter dokdonensis DS-58 TaxID=1300345 RepID=A0A0A2X1N6_9GAMM|nr:DUF4350 domain-containing protein [Lysobacter dokdonensis]KGQ19104.1 hypothetical protein LF41_3136 [Lysobacter dokdonensis DS-58]
MTRGKGIAIGLVAATAIGLLIAWAVYAFERKTVDIPLPPKGEAVYNPLYALKIALVNDRQRVHSRPYLFDDKHPLQAGDTVLMLADPARLSRRESDALRAHVARGGHLVVQPPVALLDDDADVPLLEGFGVGKHAFIDDVCMQMTAKRDVPEGADPMEALQGIFERGLLCDDRFALYEDAEPTIEWGDKEGYAFARFRHGAGTIDVVATLDPARNAGLRRDYNAALVRQLLQPNWGRGTFHLVYASQMPPLWRLMAEYAWQALLALALAVAAWLWMRMQRFGPRLPAPPEARRSLLEHVQATGDHLYRYGRAHLLHAALRAHVLAKLRRKDAVAAALEGDVQAEVLAKRTGLPAADIADALRSPRPFDAKDFRYRIARLIALGRHT